MGPAYEPEGQRTGSGAEEDGCASAARGSSNLLLLFEPHTERGDTHCATDCHYHSGAPHGRSNHGAPGRASEPRRAARTARGLTGVPPIAEAEEGRGDQSG